MNFSESLESLRQSFIEALRVRGYSPATLYSRNGSLDLFFRYLAAAGIDDVREVNRETVRAYHAWMMESGKYKTHTVHVRIIALRRFFEHLEKTDAVLVNPCNGLYLPKLERRLPRRVLTQAEARRILDAPDTQTRKGIRDKAILEVFYSTGIRLEEMSQLTIHDVDTRNGFLRVNKVKFAKDRVVPMGRKAGNYVREYLQRVRFEWSKEKKDERALWLSPIRPHQPIKKPAISLIVRQYARATLGRSISPHVWRHTCATHLVANGSNIAYVQRILGHRSINTTQIYTRVSLTEIRRTHRLAHPRAKMTLGKGHSRARIKNP